MKQKFTSTIAGASIFISLLGLLSRGLGFLREMVFANNFGLEKEFDLYLIGAVLPITINTIILYIGQNFFIPGFQKINSENPEESHKYYNQSFILFVGSGIIIALLLFFLSDFIINLYLQAPDLQSRETATLIFKIFLFTIPFSAGISMLSALLQTLYEFKYPSISVLFLNISIIVMLILFTDKMGIYVISVGYFIGNLFQFSYLLFKSRKYFKLSLISHLRKYYLLKSVIGSSLVIILLIESLGQLYSIFDRYFYAYISPGGIASLNYAYIIFLLPISIFSISLATAVFPKITHAINNSTSNELERIYNESISVNILIFMPMTFLFFCFGETIIKLAFERGKFLAESTTITYTALMCYTVSLVFYSAYSVFNKIFYSINLAKYLLAITIVGIIIKLAFNFLLVGEYHQYGLAVSTTISYLFFFIVSYLVLNKKLKIKDKNLFFKEFFIYLINCCISFSIVYIFLKIVPVRNMITEMIAIMFFIFIYLVNLFLVKHKSILLFNQVFQRLNPFGFTKII
jgi:putative peptidoglycan lipid II flippase